jgi:ribonucleoside-diphosphate reductase beta chain
VIAGYRHFARLARSLAWSPAAFDLRADGEAWPGLAPDRRRRLGLLLAGFCVAESSVSEQLEPFAAASADADRNAVFAAQRADEERHAEFFDRVTQEVLRLPGATAAERRSAARTAVGDDLLELFERRLPKVASALAADSVKLDAAVGLYHMVLEGSVLAAGQRALLAELDDGALPAVRDGVGHVERDERWHVGFGLRCLLDLRPEPALVGRILCEGERAIGVWGDAVGIGVVTRVAAMHRRRLGAVGLLPVGAGQPQATASSAA